MIGVTDQSVTVSISSAAVPHAVGSSDRDSTDSTGLVCALRVNLLSESDDA